ncbi:MAG: NUDIX domain-containing protein [Promethearchaeota archaeon]|nr:MAG: NUDIX domain-containing protein [Candidatus Lokiarchaeota archaeon]
MIGRINVQVFLFTNHPIFRVLILQRIPERSSYWQPISGGIEKGENPIDTVIREVREETGIKKLKNIIDLDYTFIFETMWHGKLTKMKEMCFAGEIKKIKKIRLSNEHQDYKWCTEKEAKNFLKWEHNLIALNKLGASTKSAL